MMQVKQLPFRAFVSSLLLLSINLTQAGSTNAQLNTQPKLCSTDGNYEPAASTYQTVRIRDFGIEVDIPSNYKVMRRKDNSIEILHPDDFAVFQCIARGGQGASGYYSQNIQLVDRVSAMSLRDQAIWAVGYELDTRGNRQPSVAQIFDHKQGNLSGYIVSSKTGYSTVFLGMMQGKKKALQVSIGCDCSVEPKEVSNLLSRIRLIKARG